MNTKKPPSVSILLSTYNRPRLLRRAAESVFAQNFSDWEFIIIDDASTDDTPQVAADLAARDPRVRVIRSEANSYPDISKVLNQGLAEARGKYIARLDDDDYWIDADKLKTQFEFLEKNSDYLVAGGGMVVVDKKGNELYRYFKKETDAEIRKTALFANPFSHTTVMFVARAAREAGGYGGWRYAEDWDLWLRMGTKGKLYNFPRYFTAYLQAGQNKSFLYQRAQMETVLKFIVKHRKEYPGFYRAYALNFLQLLWTYAPLFLRRRLHPALVSIKRKIF